MDFLDLVILICVIYTSFTVGSICDEFIENKNMVNEFQIELNESIEIQNQMKIDYEKKMFKIATNDTMAKEYAIEYAKSHTLLFDEFDESNIFLTSYDIIKQLETSDRYYFELEELYEDDLRTI